MSRGLYKQMSKCQDAADRSREPASSVNLSIREYWEQHYDYHKKVIEIKIYK